MTEPRDVPPAHQTATFDQAYAGISATIDELVGSYRRIRAENAATREIDIAGLVGYLLDSPNPRESFIEHYVVAVVRLAEAEDERDEAKQVMAEEITAIAEERVATRREDVLALIHERDALKAATDRVRALHDLPENALCVECCVPKPCPTLADLDVPTETPATT